MPSRVLHRLMRKMSKFKVPERYRVLSGPLGSGIANGNNGAFQIPLKKYPKKIEAFAIASDGMGWEHVSVSIMTAAKRTPTWDEMQYIKVLFWGNSETVIQFHPTESEYVDMHKYTLHLWRKIGVTHELPPNILV